MQCSWMYDDVVICTFILSLSLPSATQQGHEVEPHLDNVWDVLGTATIMGTYRFAFTPMLSMDGLEELRPSYTRCEQLHLRLPVASSIPPASRHIIISANIRVRKQTWYAQGTHCCWNTRRRMWAMDKSLKVMSVKFIVLDCLGLALATT